MVQPVTPFFHLSTHQLICLAAFSVRNVWIQGETVTSYMGGTPCERVLMKPFLSLMLLQSALVLPETVKGKAD